MSDDSMSDIIISENEHRELESLKCQLSVRETKRHIDEMALQTMRMKYKEAKRDLEHLDTLIDLTNVDIQTHPETTINTLPLELHFLVTDARIRGVAIESTEGITFMHGNVELRAEKDVVLVVMQDRTEHRFSLHVFGDMGIARAFYDRDVLYNESDMIFVPEKLGACKHTNIRQVYKYFLSNTDGNIPRAVASLFHYACRRRGHKSIREWCTRKTTNIFE